MTPDHPRSQTPASGSAHSLRLFIAVPLPDEIREQVTALSQNLQKGFHFTPNRPAWCDPATTHLTLIFLGLTPENTLPAIAAALDRIAANFAPLRLEIKRLGVFPHWRAPRVLWAGVRDRSHQVPALHQALENALAPLGYRPEDREYHPHLTLARFKMLKGMGAAEKLVNDHQGFKFGPFEAPEVVLYKSELHPAGARHTPLHSAALTAPPPPRKEDDRDDE